MKLGTRDRRALALLGAAVAVMLVWRFAATRPADTVEAAVDSAPLAEKRLARLRQIAVTVPGKQAAADQAARQLAAKEKGMIRAETAQQAQAQLLQIARRIGKAENIDARGGEFGPIRRLGDHYGEVTVSLSFDCRIEQLVNFLAALTSEPELLATTEIQISSGNVKEKILGVRLAISGVVPRELAPERKGAVSF